MSIKITVKQFVRAVQSGALGRFFALDRPLQVAWKNRKQVSVCDGEYKLYQEKFQALCQKYGTRHPDNPSVYQFDVGNPDLKPGDLGPQKKLFNEELAALEAMTIDDIPGEPVKVSEASGTLKTSDAELLEGSFLVD